jgi:hypothetical protein
MTGRKQPRRRPHLPVSTHHAVDGYRSILLFGTDMQSIIRCMYITLRRQSSWWPTADILRYSSVDNYEISGQRLTGPNPLAPGTGTVNAGLLELLSAFLKQPFL